MKSGVPGDVVRLQLIAKIDLTAEELEALEHFKRDNGQRDRAS